MVCINIVFAEEPPHWKNTDYLINSFIDVALNNEYSAAESTVRRWDSPINYYFMHRSLDKELHEQLTLLHLQHLAAITDVKIQAAPHKNKANLFIIFSNEASLNHDLQHEFKIKSAQKREQLVRHSVCLANITTYKNGSMRKAIIIIPVDRARAHAKLVACIVEEITQIMGLPNDSDKVFPSIFNDKSYNDLLSGLDYVLLKMLYHPTLKSGMSKRQAKPILKKIIHSFRQQGLIDKATKEVTKGGLYALF